MTKLRNVRGRIIEVNADEQAKIPLLLKQGFVMVPEDQRSEYSQVYDHGDNETQRRPAVGPEMMKVSKMSDVLHVEEA